MSSAATPASGLAGGVTRADLGEQCLGLGGGKEPLGAGDELQEQLVQLGGLPGVLLTQGASAVDDDPRDGELWSSTAGRSPAIRVVVPRGHCLTWGTWEGGSPRRAVLPVAGGTRPAGEDAANARLRTSLPSGGGQGYLCLIQRFCRDRARRDQVAPRCWVDRGSAEGWVR
jgi:hypothetical protein